MNYGIVLKEKEFLTGLNKEDIIELLSMFDNNVEVYPIELELEKYDCSVMGFITKEVAQLFDYNYKESGLCDFVEVVFDNINNNDNEEEFCYCYKFRGVNIWLSQCNN